MTPINASASYGPRIRRGRRSLPTPLLGFAGGALAALAASALTFPNMAMAQDTRREVVTYRDLDLTDPQGVAALEQRVALAARRVCSRPESNRFLYASPRSCVEASYAEALPKIDEAVARRRAALRVSVPETDMRSR
jgi:UrcA family protein